MKILLVNKYHYIRGGSETYYFGLAELLKNAGHEVIFFAMEDEKNFPCEQSQFFVSNIEFNGDLTLGQKVKAGLHMVYSFEAKKKMCQLIETEKPDIIHINLFHRVLTASIVDAAKQYQIPVVFTMHDLNCMCPNHTMLDHGNICEACLYGNYWNCVKRVCFKDSKLKCFMAALESWFNKVSGLYNKIDLYITPSEFYRNKMLESGLTKSKIVCMRNFLSPDISFESTGTNHGYYLYFGRLSEEKGVFTLLKAISKIGSVKLEVAGTGSQEQELQEFVKKYDLDKQVHFNGFLSGEKLTSIVNNAKCIVLPSEWYENGPYSIMEAMAAGKPVIVSGEGGLPEIVTANKTGFVSKAFDADDLAKCIQRMETLSPKEYTEMSRHAANQARLLFDSQRYCIKIVDYYQMLIENSRK